LNLLYNICIDCLHIFYIRWVGGRELIVEKLRVVEKEIEKN